MQLVCDDKTHGHMTFHVKIAILSYNCSDSLLPVDNPVTEINYNVNLSNTIIGGMNLALCDGGANGCIKSNDMRILHYNSDRRRVNIGITGDHQLTWASLHTGVLKTKSNEGWVKLIWNQCAEVTS